MSATLTGHEVLPGASASFLSDDDPRNKTLEQYMQPEGDPDRKLGLSRLLESKRWKYKIVDAAFRYQAVFDNVLLHQIESQEAEESHGKIPGSTILYATKNTQKLNLQEHPRGVIVSAGAKALESLKSHGMDIGHTVIMMRLSPWHLPVLSVPGVQQYLMVLRVGSLIASEDLARDIKERRVSYRMNKKTCQVEFHDEEGHAWVPDDTTNDPEYG